ncbi:MAG: sulfatase-like hydrolase/transferase [Gammaproteobacteria bacterium]|nr:sulfatase-like hydrolase/transferase [Gammaproteobacteria bacterium]
MTVAPANLLFILAESHAPDLLGALGNPYIHTPNLDRLARRGTLFDAAYCASPLCVPARAAIATGQFPHQSGYWESSLAFDGRVDSWMKRLREGGYHTPGMGKMHFRRDADDYGYSEFCETMHIADGIGDLVGALRWEHAEPTYPGLWDLWTRQYGTGDQDPYRRYDERIIERAIAWLRDEAGRDDKPWALSVHTIAAHAPFVVPREYRDLYDPASLPPPIRFAENERPRHPSIEHLRRSIGTEYDCSVEQVQQIRAAYFATVTYLDALVGRLLDTLEEQGLAESTRVVYTSDHGFSCGDHYIFGLFHLLEESLGVPLIMAGPDVPAGARVATPVSHVDLFPTLLEACGVPVDQRDSGLYGESLFRLFDGSPARKPLVAEYHGCCTLDAGYVVRDGNLKLIYFVDMPPQLYDLETDPLEANDIATQDPQALARMLSLLRDWLDPEAEDRRAKHAQRELIERHGGRREVLRKMGGFSYSPPPGLSWQDMSPK